LLKHRTAKEIREVVEHQSWKGKDNIKILRLQEYVNVVSIMVVHVSRKKIA